MKIFSSLMLLILVIFNLGQSKAQDKKRKNFKVAANRGKYHIVAGAFRNKENADIKLVELKEKGFHPIHIGKNKFGLHQIVYDSFQERNDAINQLNKIRQNDNSEAWLLIKEF